MRMRTRRITVVLCGLAALVLFTLRDVLVARDAVVPGRDAVEMYVWEYYTRSALSTGTLPFWNPLHFAGTPHLADVQKTVLYPLALLLRWVPLDDFLSWMAALHIWIAGAGVFFLARVVGLGWMASTATAIAGMLGGTTGPRLNNGHLLLLYVGAWFPWALGLAMVSVRRPTVVPHPALVVVLVLQFLAGFIQISLYLVTAVCLYYAYSLVWRESVDRSTRRRVLVQVIVLGALCLGLAAFQLVPTARLVAHAARASGIPYEKAIDGGWAAHNLVSFFFPFFGIASEHPHRELSEAVAYVGWVLTAMVPLAFFDSQRRRIVVFLALLTCLALAIVITDLPFYRLHHALFPGFRVPGRILFVASLSLTVLGGVGLERFVELASIRRWRVLAAGLAPSAAALVAAGLVVRSANGTGHLLPPVPAWPWLPALAVIGLALATVVAARKRTTMALAIALVLVTSELVAFTSGAAAPVSIQSADDVRRLIGTPSAGRGISTCENRISAGEMLRNRQASLDGFAGGIVLRDYADWVAVTLSGNPLSREGDLAHGMDSESGVLPVRRDLIDAANVSVVVSCVPLDAPSLTLVSTVDEVSVYRNESVRPRAFWTCGGLMTTKFAAAARIVRSRYDRDGRLQPRGYINVRWMPQLADDARLRVERRYSLADGVALDERTWRYTLEDPSAATVLALIHEAAVEDTHGVDRLTGLSTQAPLAIDDETGGGEELLTGTVPCPERGSVDVTIQDQPDGHLVAAVHASAPGYVFLSEPFYSEREAFIDGQPVTSVKANMAFTAVPVPAGTHTLELRYEPGSFRLGVAISALTLIVWAGCTVRKKGRARGAA